MSSTETPTAAPSPPRPGRRRAAVAGAVLAAVAVVGGGAYAVTQAVGADASPTSTASGGPGQAGGPGGRDGSGMAAPASGTVASTTDSTLTVTLSDGTSKTYTLSSDAVIEVDGATGTLADLKAGVKVVVLTGKPGSTDTTSTEATRVLAGSSATSGPGAGQAPPDGPSTTQTG